VRFAFPNGLTPPVVLGDVVTRNGNQLSVAAADAVHTLHVLTGWSLAQGVALEGLVVERPSLEDVYLQLTDGAL